MRGFLTIGENFQNLMIQILKLSNSSFSKFLVLFDKLCVDLYLNDTINLWMYIQKSSDQKI